MLKSQAPKPQIAYNSPKSISRILSWNMDVGLSMGYLNPPGLISICPMKSSNLGECCKFELISLALFARFLLVIDRSIDLSI